MKRILPILGVFVLACSGVQTSTSVDITTPDGTTHYGDPPKEAATGGLHPEASEDLSHVQRTRWRQDDGDVYNLGIGGSMDRTRADGSQGPADFGVITFDTPDKMTGAISYPKTGDTEVMTLTDACHANFSTGESAVRIEPGGC